MSSHPSEFHKSQRGVDSAESRGQDTGAEDSSLLSSMSFPKVKRQQYPHVAGERSR